MSFEFGVLNFEFALGRVPPVAESVIRQKSFAFALDIVRLYRELQRHREFVLSKQLLRSATSIGANGEEASAGQSRSDFLAKMCIAAKEARETRYWLRLLQASQLVERDYAQELAAAEEIVRILTSIVKTTRGSS
jgi:four helix bundle protein